MTFNPLVAAFATITLPSLAAANCIPPWQTLFACTIQGSDARAEFCQISDPAQHPGEKAGYYTFARGPEPAELFFRTDAIIASMKDAGRAQNDHVNPAIGYVHGTYVYAFFANGLGDPAAGPVEVRVYSSVENFMQPDTANEIQRLVCDPGSIIIDPLVLIP